MIANTLYAKYIQEREGLEIIENENGFIIYKLYPDECLIVDMFVDNHVRGEGFGRQLLDELKTKAVGCKTITANVWISKPNSNHTLQAALACGFKVMRADNGCLIIARKLSGDEHG